MLSTTTGTLKLTVIFQHPMNSEVAAQFCRAIDVMVNTTHGRAILAQCTRCPRGTLGCGASHRRPRCKVGPYHAPWSWRLGTYRGVL